MSFQTGLSGLNASARNLDVIGHNIANANTIGMKASRAEFAEVFASSLGAAGGSNSGIGVQVERVAQLFTQGTLKVTGNQLDLAINGGGFFSVGQLENGTNRVTDELFTRNGQFKLDSNGFMVTNSGLNLLGTRTTSNGETTGVPIQFQTRAGIHGQATGSSGANSGIGLVANLSSTQPVVSAGNVNELIQAFNPDENLGLFSRTSLSIFDAQGVPAQFDIFFVKIGEYLSPTADPTADPPVTPTEVNSRWAVFGRVEGSTVLHPMANIVFNGAGDVPPDGFSPIPVSIPRASGFPSQTLNFQLNPGMLGIRVSGAPFGVFDLRQDGYRPGQLTSIDIGENGVILARYSNGISQAKFRVDLVNFRNVQGLEPVNGGFWRATVASGEKVPGFPQESGLGLIRQNALEESNVDLTQELVNMIVAQRSYQANAQTIKTQDQVLQTLINLR